MGWIKRGSKLLGPFPKKALANPSNFNTGEGGKIKITISVWFCIVRENDQGTQTLGTESLAQQSRVLREKRPWFEKGSRHDARWNGPGRLLGFFVLFCLC